jgi:nitroreductase
MQRWRFLVIRDPKVKETVGGLVQARLGRAGCTAVSDWLTCPWYEPRALSTAARCGGIFSRARPPVWMVPCLEGGRPTRTSGSSIYPAIQNMLLAARALGLGETLTTPYLQYEKEAEAALGLPPGVHSYALLPIGYPMGISDQSAASPSPMSSTKSGGASPAAI